ncbi:MAG: phosphoribosylamine--glycine ligase [Chloroflexi bacterium]|nr:phosphoribosylamine--glycine ligase [Chloroflexota bacterium]
MKLLVIGSGAREHALVWKLAQSPKVAEIFAAPGNAGTAQLGRNLDLTASDFAGLAKAARENKIDLVVVGPENPLADGIVDHFQSLGIPIFGPNKKAAQIEASKVFAKELCFKHSLPCARSATFTDYEQARQYVKRQTPPIVVKADGLAAGKGVVVAESTEQALDALASFMAARTLGAAGQRVIIEECLLGKEVSVLAFTDGRTIVPMVPACDYKRAFDDNKGPNTGGMGAYSPPDFYSPELGGMVLRMILQPTVEAIDKEGSPYKGVLYAGLMLTNDGPKVLEFNARFGDPETQVILPRLKTDLVDIMLAVIEGKLDHLKVEWSEDACVGVVIASEGYPGQYEIGLPITGLDTLERDVLVFHAGTKAGPEPGQVLTNGGRVLTVVATGRNLAEARSRVYSNISKIQFEGSHYRTDIAVLK